MDTTPSSREKILDTGELLFSRRGFAGVGVREVAERVGLSKSALFHHFPTKCALYVAVLERILEHIDSSLARAARPGSSSLESLLAWLDAVVDVLAEHPSYAPLLLRTLFEAGVVSAEDEARLDSILERALGRVAVSLEQGVRAGELRPVSIAHMLQTVIGMTVYHFASGEFGDELLRRPIYSAAEVRRRKEHIFSLLQHGLLAQPDQGGSSGGKASR